MVTAPSPFTGPTSERASPMNDTLPSVRFVPLAASVRVSVPSSMLSRSTDSSPSLNATAKFGARAWPDVSNPRLTCGPARRISAARHSPRMSGPSANSTPSERARIVSAPPPISMSCSVNCGEGRRRASIAPVTRTLTPIMRLASASNNERWLSQSINSGPTSAATSARMIAIANPSRVVCNASSSAESNSAHAQE